MHQVDRQTPLGWAMHRGEGQGVGWVVHQVGAHPTLVHVVGQGMEVGMEGGREVVVPKDTSGAVPIWGGGM